MYFRNSADERMMDHSIHRDACDEEGKGGVDAVSPSNDEPCWSEVVRGLCAVRRPL